jgi:hypothetical protein
VTYFFSTIITIWTLFSTFTVVEESWFVTFNTLVEGSTSLTISTVFVTGGTGLIYVIFVISIRTWVDTLSVVFVSSDWTGNTTLGGSTVAS